MIKKNNKILYKIYDDSYYYLMPRSYIFAFKNSYKISNIIGVYIKGMNVRAPDSFKYYEWNKRWATAEPESSWWRYTFNFIKDSQPISKEEVFTLML